jgi:hypothetical protein
VIEDSNCPFVSCRWWVLVVVGVVVLALAALAVVAFKRHRKNKIDSKAVTAAHVQGREPSCDPVLPQDEPIRASPVASQPRKLPGLIGPPSGNSPVAAAEGNRRQAAAVPGAIYGSEDERPRPTTTDVTATLLEERRQARDTLALGDQADRAQAKVMLEERRAMLRKSRSSRATTPRVSPEEEKAAVKIQARVRGARARGETRDALNDIKRRRRRSNQPASVDPAVDL